MAVVSCLQQKIIMNGGREGSGWLAWQWNRYTSDQEQKDNRHLPEALNNHHELGNNRPVMWQEQYVTRLTTQPIRLSG